MNDFVGQNTRAAPTVQDMAKDVGLRNFMLGVYVKMMLGLLLTGSIAWSIATFPQINQYFFTRQNGILTGYTLLGMVARWLPLGVLLLAAMTRSINPRTSGFIYWLIVSSIGIGGAVWFMIYRLDSIATIFFVTASAFGALSLFGYVTRLNLTGVGNFLIMAVWGLIIGSLVNMFLHSSAVTMAISAIGVLVFAGLTAADTQKLKLMYYDLRGDQAATKVATDMGALELYLDFINMFIYLLRLFGNRR